MLQKSNVPKSAEDFVIYMTSKRLGRKCNGCNKELDEEFSIYCCEPYWYPHINDDGSRSWRQRKPTNKYYHVRQVCFQNHSDFDPKKIQYASGLQDNEQCTNLINERFNIC